MSILQKLIEEKLARKRIEDNILELLSLKYQFIDPEFMVTREGVSAGNVYSYLANRLNCMIPGSSRSVLNNY